MNEARPYASLSSGLLARKGAAKPAMRPQGYGGLEDLGWNDMGYGPGETPAPATEHVPSSIAALTPAPKIQRITPNDKHLPHGDDEYEFGEDEEPVDPIDDGAIEGRQAVAPEEPEQFAPAEPQPIEDVSPQPFEDFAPEPVQDFAPEPAQDFAPEPVQDFAPEPAQDFASEPVEDEAAESVEEPSVAAQQRAILERLEGVEPADAAPVASSPDARADVVPLPPRASKVDRRKAAFTLRLDAERHLRLRLACAVTQRSAQQIVARALDEALATIPEIEDLARQVPAKSGRASRGKA